ncbi:phosphatidylinositol glycan, class M [Metschnikowia aff. pulcherrima]|uniref:GPI mannosyltransferase 1 n=1 Tax=Metschnikowia aff. pulcherrima TaxID=2163413 RepID=A0A4P6XUL8_9ASCO|nr:phosphatidylinositol glycan, class M [Metschnikowia aff. pulcherrima]
MRFSANQLFIGGALLRVGFFCFGLYQDSHMPVKYTDIDYLVFSDAAQYVYDGLSPYRRETYRYTPLLAWMLIPNAWGGVFVHYGKFLFMLCDLLTGILISRTLSRSKHTLTTKSNLILLSLWLLNPMVITISTRGSSESVLTFIIMLSFDQYLSGRYVEAAFWLGLSIHFKIYPIIYLPAFMYHMTAGGRSFAGLRNFPILNWLNKSNVKFLMMTVMSLMAWNVIMYSIYGYEFLYHSYIYHLLRLDHRHNFSIYNISMYYKSASADAVLETGSVVWNYIGQLAANTEKIAFVPQLVLSAVIVPLLLAQNDLSTCLFVQTFAFVTFNKVMTSQYFIWFLIFLPHFAASTRMSLKNNTIRVLVIVALWIVSQACWLINAYRLEFLGESTFDKGLLYSSVFFFLTNCWMLHQFIEFS